MKIDLNKVARKIEVDNCNPLRNYYRIADNLLRQISMCTYETFVYILPLKSYKFCSFSRSLISETVPFHQDYQASLPQARLGSRKKLRSVINELESLKPEFDCRVDELNREDDESHRIGSDFPVVSRDAVKWPPVHRDPYSRPDIKKVQDFKVSV
ncbi:unnamed protein product [Eruca vesicaria subsp. sativa]|uniref:Uncharacterized protein n=1 Tax=Eruca vesicaria subsp. sativa TaxID=29727 RepID=A0ABC8JKL4_ERUVS|nr:unnamed protein product [Eruca vesicaria subsp. sativa]